MSLALTHTMGERVAETAKFTSMFDKFFDCLNVSNISQGRHKRNAFKAPYRSAKDFRLKVSYKTFNRRHSYVSVSCNVSIVYVVT